MQFLVVVDLSEISSHVVEKAVEFARAAGADVWLIHVAEPEPDFVGSKVDTKEMRDIRAEMFHKEHQQLQQYAKQFDAKGLKTTALLMQGETVKTILSEAGRLSADVIIMGSHGKSTLGRLLLGSTSEEVLHRCDIPVMIIPIREK
jgi:nucleotide-binding universal stress UspA family protein